MCRSVPGGAVEYHQPLGDLHTAASAPLSCHAAGVGDPHALCIS